MEVFLELQDSHIHGLFCQWLEGKCSGVLSVDQAKIVAI